MKIFLSWSGSRSQAVAAALHAWLNRIFGARVQPWMSKEDIQFGKRWLVEVAGELEASSFGILCITSDNTRAPWLVFEAGALSKSLGKGRVVPYLLDMDWGQLVNSPLAAFQGAVATAAETLELAQQINNLIEPPEDLQRIKWLFDQSWPELLANFEAIRSTKPPDEDLPTPKQQYETVKAIASAVGGLDQRFQALESLLGRRVSHRTLSDDDRTFFTIRPRLVSEELNDFMSHGRFSRRSLVDMLLEAFSNLSPKELALLRAAINPGEQTKASGENEGGEGGSAPP